MGDVYPFAPWEAHGFASRPRQSAKTAQLQEGQTDSAWNSSWQLHGGKYPAWWTYKKLWNMAIYSGKIHYEWENPLLINRYPLVN